VPGAIIVLSFATDPVQGRGRVYESRRKPVNEQLRYHTEEAASTVVGKHAMNVAIIGAGAWGTTLSMLSVAAGNPTTLVAHRPELAHHLTTHRRHPHSLPRVTLPLSISIETDAREAVASADIVILAVPTQKLRAAMATLRDGLGGKIVVSAAKGLESGTLVRPTEVISDVLGGDVVERLCALSGPNLATEVANGKPAATVVASRGEAAASAVQRALTTPGFRVYLSDDVVGVEMGGALKNIIAIGAGIGDGLDAGDNAKAAFLTRGIAEIARLGVASGAQALTFAGLSGIGDLIATCSSALSRNHTVGRELAKGRKLEEILASMSEVTEGVATTKAALTLGARLGVELPIVEQMHRVLFEGLSPIEAVATLMEREPTRELGGPHSP